MKSLEIGLLMLFGIGLTLLVLVMTNGFGFTPISLTSGTTFWIIFIASIGGLLTIEGMVGKKNCTDEYFDDIKSKLDELTIKKGK